MNGIQFLFFLVKRKECESCKFVQYFMASVRDKQEENCRSRAQPSRFEFLVQILRAVLYENVTAASASSVRRLVTTAQG
jgi:hypothetical protein